MKQRQEQENIPGKSRLRGTCEARESKHRPEEAFRLD